MNTVDKQVDRWNAWRRRWPAIVAMAALCCIAGRLCPTWWPVGELYDEFILPIALKFIYGHGPAMLVFALACAAAVVLRPWNRIWPALAACVAAIFIGWVILLDMWRNAPVTSAAVLCVICYAICRYRWVDVALFARGLGQRMFRSMSLSCASKQGIEAYYDAKRAVCHGGRGAESRWWNRQGAPAGDNEHGLFMGALFLLARSYRSGATMLLMPLRLMYGRRTPVSLKCQWLRFLLDIIEDITYGAASNMNAGCPEWFRAYERLIEVTEAKAEYLAFSPEDLGKGSIELASAAALYDELSRLALARQLWLANAASLAGISDEEIDSGWQRLVGFRTDAIWKSTELRAMYLGSRPEHRLNGGAAAIVARAESPRDGAQELLLILSLLQLRELTAQSGDGPQMPLELVDGIKSLGASVPEEDRAVLARKVMEIGLDWTDYRIVQQVIALGWHDARADAAMKWKCCLRLEGHAYWRMVRALRVQDLRMNAYRKAAEAFLRGGFAETSELLRDAASQSETSGSAP